VKLDLRTRLAMLETEMMLPAYEPTAGRAAGGDEALRCLLRAVGVDGVRAWVSDDAPAPRRRATSSAGPARPGGRPVPAAAAREPVFS
jgi:hypothetical protein